MLVRLVSGTLPTFAALAEWYGPPARPDMDDLETDSPGPDSETTSASESSARPSTDADTDPDSDAISDVMEDAPPAQPADGGLRLVSPRRPLAARYELLREKSIYRHARAVVLDDSGEATTACPLCAVATAAVEDEASDGGGTSVAEDTQSHWVAECPAMRVLWNRTSVTQMAFQVHAATAVAERDCWALARAVWLAVTTEPSATTDTDHLWTDRCGFFRAKQLEDLLQEESNTNVRRAFRKIKIKTLDRLIRKAMVETATEVWSQRLERLSQLP